MNRADNRKGLVSLAVGALLIGAALYVLRDRPGDPSFDPAQAKEGLPRRVAQLLASQEASRHMDPAPEGAIYLALRDDGERLAETWQEGDNWRAQVANALARLVAADPSLESRTDTVELCLPHSMAGLNLRPKRAPLSNIHRGVLGFEVRVDDEVRRYCPTDMLARNVDPESLVSEMQRALGLNTEDFYAHASARSFDAHQLLVQLDGEERVTPMFRGNTIVPMSQVNQQGVEALAKGMQQWMENQLQADGRMVYRYFPSRGEESTGNNMIRQYMASVCLVRLANYHDDPKLAEMAERNLRYNFQHFYRQDGDLGLITFRRASKLGAAALAALGIVEAPFREKLAEYELPLEAFTYHQQNPDGSFQTFYQRRERRNQNFYPGETQLLWATLYDKQQDPALLERIMRSFRYYRGWHLDPKNRNPAFIPWHTQALVKVWMKTQDPELAAFVFEINDWLLGVQEWDGARYPDSRGRFYDGSRPFGPPHASSTGVYLEGLIYAYRLARATGDEQRSAAYRRAILRGLRSLMQLQYVDEVDMYYISKRKAVQGGIRTTLYDNSIRVDNVQHGLMGILNILQTFNAEGAW